MSQLAVVIADTHLPRLEDEDGVLLLNPGSPSIRSRYSGWGAAGYVQRCWRYEADGV